MVRQRVAGVPPVVATGEPEGLNIAENELSAMTRQCLDRRIPDRETLEQETTAWYIQRNHLQKSVDWQFTTENARIRLKRLYPQIEN